MVAMVCLKSFASSDELRVRGLVQSYKSFVQASTVCINSVAVIVTNDRVGGGSNRWIVENGNLQMDA
eukprot:5783028-Amphidinium_carterae.1